MGFLEQGFPLFSLIVIWNIFLLGFGGVTSSSLIQDQNFSGLQTIGEVNVNLVNPGTTAVPYIAPTTTPEENVPRFQDAGVFVTGTWNVVSKVIFGGADAIEQTGIPAPLDWVLGTIIRIFMAGYIGLFAYTLVSGWKGGGVGAA